MTEQKSTALITGASRGLGLALARELARSGWVLIITARGADALKDAERELAALTTVRAVAGDVSEAAHRDILAQAAKDLGGLSALVNNASSLGPSPRPALLDYPLEDLEAVYRTNVIVPLALIQRLQTTLQPGARILNITSDAGVVPYAGWGGYGSSKAALEHLSAILAQERPDWRVYWVDPGDMRTQMHQEAFPGEDISDRPPAEESVPGLLRLLTDDVPSGRYQARPSQTGPAKSVSGLRVVLTVADFEKATDFYEHGLGLRLLDQWRESESNGVLLDAGAATLELIDEGQAQEVDQIEVGKRSAGAVRLAFTVQALNEAAETLKGHGGQAITEPILTPWQHLNQRWQAPLGDDIQITLSEVVEPEQEKTR